jgi:hypothetical protein
MIDREQEAKRTSAGRPVTVNVEVGPLVHYGFGKVDIALMERRTRDAIDAAVRGYLRVGKRHKVVRTRIDEA